jgi:ribosome-associated heat shock protein Hsp15
MRVDKYLWSIRVFKTRSQATTHCKEGKVRVSGKAVKPALELKGQETIEVRKGAVTFSFQVLALPKSRLGAPLVPDYVRDVTPQSELDKLDQIREAQRDLLRPVGRPTKRDRRDWEKYFE